MKYRSTRLPPELQFYIYQYFMFVFAVTGTGAALVPVPDFLIQIIIYQYLTVTYEYLVNTYIVTTIFNRS